MCFKRAANFGPNHTCKNKNLHVMILELEPEKKEENSKQVTKLIEEDTKIEGDTRMELSLNSMVSFRGNHTIKVHRKLGETEIILPIDSGATHNFIAEELISKARIPVEEIAVYFITVGDRFRIKGRQHCKDLKLKV